MNKVGIFTNILIWKYAGNAKKNYQGKFTLGVNYNYYSKTKTIMNQEQKKQKKTKSFNIY